MAISTPWGPAQTSRTIAVGIMRYTTAGHGGLHLSKERVDTMAPALLDQLRKIGAIDLSGEVWLEEDNEYSLAVLAFPSEFDEASRACADSTLKNHYPDTWEAITGQELKPGESRIRDEQRFAEENKNNHVMVRCYGQLYLHVPANMVGVATTVGGVHHRDAVESYWLVPEPEFDASPYNFVVDPARHQQLDVKLGAYKPAFANAPAALAR